MYIEVIECENVFTTPLTAKLLDNNLQTVKSQENLLNMAANTTTTTTTSTNANNNNNIPPPTNGTESDTNSQVNFNIQESVSQPQLQPPADSASAKVKIIGEKETNQPTNGKQHTPATNSFFDPNNCDRWSISSDVGPINSYSNGNFKVSFLFLNFFKDNIFNIEILLYCIIN